MDRRTLLKTGGTGLMGLLGLGLGACSRTSGLSSLSPRLRLATVRASWDRVIRTTVGLRPYRPSGFVLRAERLDGKTLIHNYGHGGSGMSLSWGTASMAADIAGERDERRAAVIGCGVVGLTTARQLQRRGFDVTIYAMTVPPDTTSNMSLAAWTPTSGLVDRPRRTAAWDAQLRQAARIAYRQLQLLIGPEYGVSWIDSYALRDTEPSGGGRRADPDPLLPPELRTESTLLGPGEHPFPTRYASAGTTLPQLQYWRPSITGAIRRGPGSCPGRRRGTARPSPGCASGGRRACRPRPWFRFQNARWPCGRARYSY